MRLSGAALIFGAAVAAAMAIACDGSDATATPGSGLTPGTPLATISGTTATGASQAGAPTIPPQAPDTPAAAASPAATPAASPAAGTTPTPDGAVATPTAVASTTPTPVATPTSQPVDVQPEPLTELSVQRLYPWLTPQRPTHMAPAPDGSGRIFISEQAGRLLAIPADPNSAVNSATAVLDIRDRVSTSGNKEGFLGFAFHPDFADSGRLFVYYSAANPRRSVISEIAFAQDGVGDEGSERIVMQVSQPEWNHNGGTLIFGPDGYLYISLGDGGGGGDPRGNGQNVGTILGSILRIDVDAPGVPYGIPPGNPFADREPVNGVVPAPEVWAYGLRNPWKLAFDPLTGEMWAGDVGQNRVEEVDLIVKGGNYGWNIKEGPDCYQPSSNCESQAQGPLIEPIASYTHSSGCSVTGGYVYRGSRLPSLYGAYIYADYCSGIIWALRYEDGEVTEQRIIADTSSQIPSFGQMPDGEVYILTASDGIQRFVAL